MRESTFSDFKFPLCSCHFNDRLLLGLKGTMSEARVPCAKGSFAWRHPEQSPARRIEDAAAWWAWFMIRRCESCSIPIKSSKTHQEADHRRLPLRESPLKKSLTLGRDADCRKDEGVSVGRAGARLSGRVRPMDGRRQRHCIFVGMRDEKAAAKVVREA